MWIECLHMSTALLHRRACDSERDAPDPARRLPELRTTSKRLGERFSHGVISDIAVAREQQECSLELRAILPVDPFQIDRLGTHLGLHHGIRHLVDIGRRKRQNPKKVICLQPADDRTTHVDTRRYRAIQSSCALWGRR